MGWVVGRYWAGRPAEFMVSPKVWESDPVGATVFDSLMEAEKCLWSTHDMKLKTMGGDGKSLITKILWETETDQFAIEARMQS